MQSDRPSLPRLMRTGHRHLLLPALLLLSACATASPSEEPAAWESKVRTCCDREYDDQPVLICPFVCRRKPQHGPESEQSESDRNAPGRSPT
jgi:hypothetical protein